MINIEYIYNKEKEINSYFRKKYDYNDPEIFYKQVLELCVELGELIYETKCFKYWKDDKPSGADKILTEYADCLMVTLSLCDLKNIDISNLPETNEPDIIKQFIKLYYLSSQITMNTDGKLLLEILSNLLNLSNLLKYTDEDIEKYCDLKLTSTLEMIRKK